jgi:3-hydroxyacyl-CoA dehydrogenase
MSVVDYQVHEQIGIIWINNPPVNALSSELRNGIHQAVLNAQSDATKALLLICKGRTFIAGADISEFDKPATKPSFNDILGTIESSSKPVIAAIHGTALGGGLETALACHYRCAVGSAMVGLPEVKLGLLPGAGGTQRVPRLIGIEAAIKMITGGNPIPAAAALSAKLIDHVIDGDDLLQGALAYTEQLIADNAPLKRVRDITIDPSSIPAGTFDTIRAQFAVQARGLIAPQQIINCIEAAATLPFDEGLAAEQRFFHECMVSSQSAAMRHMFFAQREANKIKGLPKDTPQRPIKSVAIIGGGTMGGGIAMNFASIGIPVTLLEINPEALQRGLGIVEKNYSNSVKKGKLSDAKKQACMDLISGTTDYQDLAHVDLVIEAVFENLAIKQQVFSQLDKVCKPGAILATNTSYQNIDQIAAATQRPQDVIGLHFFSPANIMKLLEIVRADKTADDVIATAMQLAKTIGKVPVLARVCDGFIGNRMFSEYSREAQLCLIEGSTPEQIDTVMQDFGMAMGPIAVGDLAGIDIGYKVREVLSDEQKGNPASYCIADALVEMGRLGQKTGAGYYKYDAQTRARTNDPEVMALVGSMAVAHNITRREFSDAELVLRLILPLINEGAKILEEGIAQRPGDIDVVYVFGYGFPVYRGGPMQYADELGLASVYEQLTRLHQETGEASWQPATLIKTLAETGSSFAQWANEQA